jgi:hypothetical protein
MSLKGAICLIDKDFLVDKTFDALATQVRFISYNSFLWLSKSKLIYLLRSI